MEIIPCARLPADVGSLVCVVLKKLWGVGGEMPEKGDNELWVEILQRLVRIEENTKGVDKISEIATSALAKSVENEKDIAEIKENQKWTWRTVAGIGVSVIVYFITRFL